MADILPTRRLGALPLAKIGIRLTTTVLLAAVAAVLAVMVVPVAFGYGILNIATGSMAPEVPPGSLVLVRSVAREAVAVGDVLVVARGSDKAPVLHRVVERAVVEDEVIVRTKGDANPTADTDAYVLPERTLVRALHVPKLGTATGLLATPVGWVLGALLPATVLCGLALCSIWSDPATPRPAVEAA